LHRPDGLAEAAQGDGEENGADDGESEEWLPDDLQARAVPPPLQAELPGFFHIGARGDVDGTPLSSRCDGIDFVGSTLGPPSLRDSPLLVAIHAHLARSRLSPIREAVR